MTFIFVAPSLCHETDNFARNLPRAIGAGIGNWAIGYASSKASGTKLTAALIYMPLFVTGTGAVRNIQTPASVRFGQIKVPISLVFGSPKNTFGQLFGLGLQMPNDRQLIRMDYHPWHTGRGVKGSGAGAGELSAWEDGQFHYHVRKWNQ